MAQFQSLPNSTFILRTSDGAVIPSDSGNSDYQHYLSWTNSGNTPDPVPPAHVDTSTEAAMKQILANDALMFRALEVLVDVLLAKGTILATDFPSPVRTLYLARKALRTTAGLP